MPSKEPYTVTVRGDTPQDVPARVNTAHAAALKDLAAGLSTSQAGRALGCSSEWIRQLIARGELVAVQTPLGALVTADSLAEYQARKGAGNG